LNEKDDISGHQMQIS